MSQISGSFLLTLAQIGVFSGLLLALPEEVVFLTVLFEKESFLVCLGLGGSLGFRQANSKSAG